MAKAYKSEALAAIHESMADLHKIGMLDSKTMREFDQALDEDDYQKGKVAYDELMRILHPQSAERKLLDIQFSQLAPDDDKA